MSAASYARKGASIHSHLRWTWHGSFLYDFPGMFFLSKLTRYIRGGAVCAMMNCSTYIPEHGDGLIPPFLLLSQQDVLVFPGPPAPNQSYSPSSSLPVPSAKTALPFPFPLPLPLTCPGCGRSLTSSSSSSSLPLATAFPFPFPLPPFDPELAVRIAPPILGPTAFAAGRGLSRPPSNVALTFS